ncbi:MAG: phospho-N-acetylmuramoyl-pentapeptide-transferase [Ruminococcaceae bacterium]|nr:phospho-N-acetylmuramoyl-pentapeptide-transferase [Oscillospiraceae bacterium]
MNSCQIVAMITLAVSLILGVILYKIFIPLLRKVKLGQKILEIGPSWHKCKEGTPNLGGLFFIIACVVAYLVGTWRLSSLGILEKQTNYFAMSITLFGLALSQGVIGFVDDYVKLFKKRNKGLSGTQKLILQFLSVAVYLFVNVRYNGYDTVIEFPWGASVDFGIFYYFIMLLAIAYIINCANLTDGIDGLAGSIAFIISILFLLYGLNSDNMAIAIPCAALCGGLLAFLIFNFHPAKIFMGDTGSLYLGGFIVGVVMLTNSEVLLLPISCIWIIEGLSVIIQVGSFKLTGKRVFKMSPIHHHFEKCGWSEVKIVAVFSAITVLFCALTYYLLII